VSFCAGGTGIADAAFEESDFSLGSPNEQQAAEDDVTFDSAVPTALGNYGAVGPNQCVTGDIFLDATRGSDWSSVNFSYDSGGRQLVYVWHAG
jgi:hypothetical protein